MLFTFVGSTHSKYTTYLLEFLTNLELESSRALRETTLNAMLVNLSGREGAFSAGDIIQEFFNRLLEAIIERKGADFGDTFIRQVISQNLHHMGRVKTDLREGVGLAMRSGKHCEPHTNPEVKTLLRQYAYHELHSRRPGRTIEDDDVDDFRKGWQNLANGKLRRWVADTVRSRSWRNAAAKGKGDTEVVEGDSEDDENGESEQDEVDPDPSASTFGSMRMVDGQFVIETGGFEDTIQDYMSMLDGEHDASESDRDAEELESEDNSSS
jgi:hypothetical protein